MGSIYMTPRVSNIRLELRRRNVIRNIATLFSGSVLSQGMTALAFLLTARQLGPDAYGRYVACFAVAGVSAIVFNLGMDIWLLREGSCRLSNLGELLGNVLLIKVVGGGLWLVLLRLVASFLNFETYPVNLLSCSAIVVWLDSLFGTLLIIYKASLHNRVTLIGELISDGFWLLITWLLIRNGEQNIIVYVQVRAGVLFVSFILLLLFTWRLMPLQINLSSIKPLLRETVPFAASEFLAWVSMRGDVLIMAFILGEYAVGLYSPVVGLANALFFIPGTVYNVILPVLSNLFSTNVTQAWLTAKRSVLLLFVVGIVLSITLFVGAGAFVALLGKDFVESRQLLQILSVILVVHSLSFGMASILVATHQQAKRTMVQVVAVFVNILLNFLALPFVGVKGAAIVYVITEIILMGGYAWLVWRYRRVSTLACVQKAQSVV